MSGMLLALALSAAPFVAPPLPDPALERLRGGFRLPSGIDVAIAVDTQTAVNGAVVLRTAFRADQGTPTVTVYVPKDGTTVPLPAGSANHAGTASSTAPTISYDAQHGIQVNGGQGVPNITVGGSGAGAAGAVPDGLQTVPSGSALQTAAGTLSQGQRGSADVVTLNSGDLSITHLTGGAFGSQIVNSGSDRAIDTETTMSISLSNATPANIGSAMFRVGDVATGALQTRIN